MKKRIAALALAALLALGMGKSAQAAYDDGLSVSAADAAGNPVSAAYEEVDYGDLVEMFWENEEVKAVDNALAACFGLKPEDNLTCVAPYGTGRLDLTQSGASQESPVTVTFTGSTVDLAYYSKVAGEDWLYVFQEQQDGTCQLHKAEYVSENALSAEFTDSGISRVFLVEFSLARESLNYDLEDVSDLTVVQSAADAQGNPVSVTVTPLDADMKAVIATLGIEDMDYKFEPICSVADVNLVGASASADNPVTITFAVDGVKAGETVTVYHLTASSGWEKLPAAVGDGAVTVTFTSLSPVGIVRAGKAIGGESNTGDGNGQTPADSNGNGNGQAPADSNGNGNGQAPADSNGGSNSGSKPVSPKTGEMEEHMFVCAAVFCLALGAGIAWAKKKKIY